MMQRMCGGSGSDGGDVTTEMTLDKNIKKYLDFFCYFKTLSKMCHLAMTVRKDLNIKKKISNNNAKIAKLIAESDQNNKLIESLNFYKAIETEI